MKVKNCGSDDSVNKLDIENDNENYFLLLRICFRCWAVFVDTSEANAEVEMFSLIDKWKQSVENILVQEKMTEYFKKNWIFHYWKFKRHTYIIVKEKLNPKTKLRPAAYMLHLKNINHIFSIINLKLSRRINKTFIYKCILNILYCLSLIHI